MRIGLSSYSLDREIEAGRMTLAEAMDWAAQMGAECMELVPFAFGFEDAEGGIDDTAIARARRQAQDAGIALCNYSVLADLCKEDPAAQQAEIARVKKHVEIAARLGLSRMRHDISAFRRPRGENGWVDYERLFPQMVDAAGTIADFAAGLGVTTLVENHGFFVNGCDRVERLVRTVNRDNYSLLLDTGNIACVDEDPSAAAKRLAPLCSMIHLKDFYIRRRDPGDATSFDCAGSWFTSMAGRYLRGAILGQGDLDIYEILAAIKGAGYDGDIVIEFEGMEDARYASKVGLDNARRIWDAV